MRFSYLNKRGEAVDETIRQLDQIYKDRLKNEMQYSNTHQKTPLKNRTNQQNRQQKASLLIYQSSMKKTKQDDIFMSKKTKDVPDQKLNPYLKRGKESYRRKDMLIEAQLNITEKDVQSFITIFLDNFFRFFDKKQVQQAIRERMGYMEKHYAHYLQKTHKFFKEFGDLNDAALDEKLFLIGRLMCSSKGNINPKSAILEVLSKKDEPMTIPLDINEEVYLLIGVSYLFQTLTKNYTIYTGQFIVVEGCVQKSPRRFLVERLYDCTFTQNIIIQFLLETLIQYQTKKDIISDIKQANKKIRETDENTSVIITSGPYTTQEGLSFSPFCIFMLFLYNLLEKLLNNLQNQEPDVLIMLGPFLPANHLLVQTGRFKVGDQVLSLKQVYDELWKMALVGLKHTSFIVVPSLEDVFSVYPLPQPNWRKEFQQFSKRITFLSNPSSVEIEQESVFHFFSQDILLEMLKKSYYAGNCNSDRITNSLKSMLNQRQRNFLPIRPVDFSYDPLNTKALNIEEIPNFIIYPSKIAPSMKIINETVFINPGQLYKGTIGGTYCRLTIYKEDEVSIQYRTHGEILQI